MKLNQDCGDNVLLTIAKGLSERPHMVYLVNYNFLTNLKNVWSVWLAKKCQVILLTFLGYFTEDTTAP